MSEATLRLDALTEAIKERNGKPVNVRVVMATIESMGIRNSDVPVDFGFDSMIHLAAHIYKILSAPEYYQLKNQNQLTADQKSYDRVSINSYMSGIAKLFVRDYSTGMFHLMPVVVQIVAIVLFGFSLWTYVGFNNLQSTAVVLGVILGLVSTGGLVQVIGKQVSFYWYNEDYAMTYRSVKQLLRIGLRSLLAVFLVIAFINIFVHLYPFLFVAIVYVYAFLIGLLLLTLAPLYTIKQR